jgi:hypothetical protein
MQERDLMSTCELFELQSALVTCLTDPDAFSQFQAGAVAWKKLSFLDTGVMELMALSYQGKRLDKIRKVLPRTMAYLAPEMSELTSEFMRHHPPLSADSYKNGCQFYSLLQRRWRTRLPSPPFLPDLAYCELAKIGLERRTVSGGRCVLTGPTPTKKGAVMIRCRSGVRLRQCEYDIQPLLNSDGHNAAAILREPVYIVFSQPLALSSGKMFRVDHGLFVLLNQLKNWTQISLANDPRVKNKNITFIRHMEELGFVEARLCESE